MSINIADFLKSRSKQQSTKPEIAESKENDITSIDTLIESELRPFKIGWIQFVSDKDDALTLKTFTETVTNSLKCVQNGLYVLLKLPQSMKSYESAQDITNSIIKLYQIIDNLSFKTHGLTFDSRIIIIYSKEMYNTLTNTYLAKIPQIKQYSTDITFTTDICFSKYKEVVFGGTFDHLHSGHKVLITIAALSCSNTLYIGLSIDQLLVKKKFSNMLQSFDKRKVVLLDFIQCIKPDLKVMIEPLNDIYGPSVYESIQALVISKETIKGGDAVNQKRAELKRDALELIVIDFVLSSADSNKASSTEIRCFDSSYQYLYHQWNRLISQLITKQNKQVMKQFIDEWWCILFNFYQQKHRFYHSFRHIHDLIKNCIKYSSYIDNVTVVLLSIWFHDIVYDATKNDNELMSISVFKVFVEHLFCVFGELLTKDMIQKVICYIEATIKHRIKDEYRNDNDLKWFLDFDLAILGSEKDIYKAYANNIRKEYIHIKSPLFEQKRSAVMQTFLDRKQLYFTNVFQQKLENIARQNVLNEIQILKNHQ